MFKTQLAKAFSFVLQITFLYRPFLIRIGVYVLILVGVYITGYFLLFDQSSISWKSKKQTTVSKSSSEAEYRAMASAAFEVTWTVRLLEELGVTNLLPMTLHCDNQSALNIAHISVFHYRTKHIEIDYHFTRE